MTKILKFNESWFSRKKETSNDLTPKGFMSSTPRLSDEEAQKVLADVKKLNRPIEPKIDSDFLQEISDRLYGPDSEEYVKAISEINKRFRPRPGRYGSQFYDPTLHQATDKRQEELVKRFKDK